MTQTNSTLLFIPDISGFTNFVNVTEISHSRHIISELLEIIINSDQNKMTVSEIEGDAVLFYKDEMPTAEKLLEQCEVTFKNFHGHLKRYNTERICRCGACETASELSLKFIVHSGRVEKMDINGHQKLHGSDVILAHRLMKNSIKNSEYVLFSEQIDVKTLSAKSKEKLKISEGADDYKNLGTVNYSHLPLKHLHKDLPEAKSISFPELSSEKISLQQKINAPVGLVYENFTNFEKRLEWNEVIKDIIMHGGDLNQSGAMHTCLVGNDKLNIKTIGRLEDNDKIIYGERLNKFKVLRDLITIYTFEKNGEQTIIQAEIDFKIKSFFGRFLKPILKKKLFQQTKTGLHKLKTVSEQQAENLNKNND